MIHFRLLLACLVLLGIGPTARAQILQGEWVDRSDAAIDEHRKTGVIVIVLGEDDRPIRGAQVHIEQTRHDFVLGVAVSQPRPPEGEPGELPVWRCFNAVALDRLTGWRIGAAPPANEIDAAAQQWGDWLDPIEVSYGPVLSADPARTPDHAVGMDADDLSAFVMQRFNAALNADDAINRFDHYADALGHAFLEERLGPGILNKLYDTSSARRPDATHTLRVSDGLSQNGSRELRQRVQGLDIRQVRLDGVTIDQPFTGSVNPAPLERTLNDRIATLDLPVTIANLDPGGTSQAAAALNLETVLRLLFATPNVQGIYFAGVYGHEMRDPAAGLIDDAGDPMSCGQLIDTFFREIWWIDFTEASDDLGNVRARVFTGWYRITATLPDGRVLDTEAYLPKSDETPYVVFQAGPAE